MMGRLGSSLGNHTGSPHMLNPILWAFLIPNPIGLKEKKCVLDVSHSKLSSWDDYGEPVSTSYCWGLVCVMFANTQVCS